MESPYRYGIVGGGWRAEFFLRIQAAMSDRFQLLGVVVRDPEKAARLEAGYPVRTFRTVDALLDADAPEFLVSSVSYAANGEMNGRLMRTGLPILAETPPAATLDEMQGLWEQCIAANGKLQVAEQFHRQPHHAARIEAIRHGLLGPVHTAHVSVCHGYHGVSLLRRFLGIGFENAVVLGAGWSDRVRDPGNRSGAPEAPEVRTVPHQVALLSFENGAQGVFDFTSIQYYSAIRPQRVMVRGELGEIVDLTVHAADERNDAIPLRFERIAAGAFGNLEGAHLKGIRLGGEWMYRNPTAPARLSDEEIAIADMLGRMGSWVRGGGPEPYPLAEGMQDHYLGLLIREACETGVARESVCQPWSEAATG